MHFRLFPDRGKIQAARLADGRWLRQLLPMGASLRVAARCMNG